MYGLGLTPTGAGRRQAQCQCSPGADTMVRHTMQCCGLSWQTHNPELAMGHASLERDIVRPSGGMTHLGEGHRSQQLLKMAAQQSGPSSGMPLLQ